MMQSMIEAGRLSGIPKDSGANGEAQAGAIPVRPEAGAPWRWRQILRRVLALALPRRLLLVRGPAASTGLALTFDDGPHPVYTPRVLDVLRDNGVRATFFVVGDRAEEYPELLRSIADEGHVVAHHSFSHGSPAHTTARQLAGEVERTQELFLRVIGAESRLFRPPHGKLTVRKCWTLWRLRLSIVLWNRDPKDFACESDQEVTDWLRRRPLREGDLVLLHDNAAHTARGLPAIIAAARDAGLSFATVDEWVGRPSRGGGAGRRTPRSQCAEVSASSEGAS